MSDLKRRAGRSIGALAALSLSATGFALPAGAAPNDGTITLDIVAISDFHGHIENAAKLDNALKAIKASNEEGFLFAANGDLVGGSAFISAIDKDSPTMDILSTMGLQVSSTGNHEFDKGYDDLVNRVAVESAYEYLVSNIGEPKAPLAPHTIIETASGVKVGFIGAVTDQLPTLVNPTGITGLTVTDPVAAVDAQAALLKDGDESNGEADVVVALIHETASISREVGADVDAVVAGHTHFKDKETTATGAPVIEPGEYGKAFGHFKLQLDADKNVVQAEADVIELVADKIDENTPVALLPIKCENTPEANPTICAKYASALAVSQERGAVPVANIVGSADRATNDGTDLGANRGTEMTAGNLIAQAFYEYSQTMARQADFGIMNPGGVRGEVDANNDGVVTFQESFSAQPFGNDYGIVDISAAQVYTLLEQQWSHETTQTSRPMLQLGISDTLRYTYDPAAEFGSHIKQVFVDGELLDPTDTETMYTVASNSFLVAGGDGFNVFKEGENYLKTGLIDNDVFNDFLRDNDGQTIDYSQRGIAITGEDKLFENSVAVIELASLSMTYEGKDQPLPTVAEVLLDGVKIGEGAIDNTVTPNLDQTGQASVEVWVPLNIEPGAHDLTIIAGPTELTIPVKVGEVIPVPKEVTPLEGKDGNTLFADELGQPIAEYAMTLPVAGQYLVGDWDGDGVATFALGTANEYTFLNRNRVGTGRDTFTLGKDGDTAVAGDFNGDGIADLVLRGEGTNVFNVYYNTNRGTFTDAPDLTLRYGRPTDVPIAGDWDGDGRDSLGVRRGAQFLLRNELSGGGADKAFNFGRADDLPLIGEFNGEPIDDVAVARGAKIFVKETLDGGPADRAFNFGREFDARFVGDFFGTGMETIAIYRGQ
ncbi:MAG: 5'-nucleotidase C-terminal domain-containing protein [Ancrocorticia sp.]